MPKAACRFYSSSKITPGAMSVVANGVRTGHERLHQVEIPDDCEVGRNRPQTTESHWETARVAALAVSYRHLTRTLRESSPEAGCQFALETS